MDKLFVLDANTSERCNDSSSTGLLADAQRMTKLQRALYDFSWALVAAGCLPPMLACFVSACHLFEFDCLKLPSTALRWHQDGQAEHAFPVWARNGFLSLQLVQRTTSRTA